MTSQQRRRQKASLHLMLHRINKYTDLMAELLAARDVLLSMDNSEASSRDLQQLDKNIAQLRIHLDELCLSQDSEVRARADKNL
jgi:hypothetical protein